MTSSDISNLVVLESIAEANEASARALRQQIALITARAPQSAADPLSAVERARALHPVMGKRQIQILQLLEAAGAVGTNTGVISRQLSYDQPNVYLTLQRLRHLGFVDKDEATDPHTYRLGSNLR